MAIVCFLHFNLHLVGLRRMRLCLKLRSGLCPKNPQGTLSLDPASPAFYLSLRSVLFFTLCLFFSLVSFPHSSFLIPHSSLLTSHSSLLIPHFSFLIPHSSFLTPHFSFLTPHSSFLTPHSSLYSLYRLTKPL